MMTLDYREYRKKSGMLNFERHCRFSIGQRVLCGIRIKCYKVPGTVEHEQWGEYVEEYFRNQNNNSDGPI